MIPSVDAQEGAPGTGAVRLPVRADSRTPARGHRQTHPRQARGWTGQARNQGAGQNRHAADLNPAHDQRTR